MRIVKKHFFLLYCSILGLLCVPSLLLASYLNLPKDGEGWTVLRPSADTDVVYVSGSGNDSTCRSYRTTAPEMGSDPFEPVGAILPCATYTKAYSLTGSGQPDWILFKRGGTFTASNLSVRSGKDADEPFLIGSYGTSGSSPIIKTGPASALNLTGSLRWLAIMGLDFYSNTRDPGGGDYVNGTGVNGFRYVLAAGQSAEGILLEGCKFRFYTNNVFQNSIGVAMGGISLRRNLFTDNYSDTDASHAQGLYAQQVDGILLEENIFIHNGWYKQADGTHTGGVATMFNHNTYFSSVDSATFADNIFIESSNSHNKFTGEHTADYITLSNNLYIGGEIGVSACDNYPDVDYRIGNATVTDNVFTQIGMSRPENKTLAWYLWLQGWDVGTVSRNLLLNQKNTANSNTIGIKLEDDNRGVTFSNNIIYNLYSGRGMHITATLGAASTNIMFSNNKIQIISDSEETIYAEWDVSSAYSFSDNVYYSDFSTNYQFKNNNVYKTFIQWKAETGDNSTFLQHSFPDSTRDIDTYQQYLGETATIAAFIAACRVQDRHNWDTRYTAPVINNWIRDGFFPGIITPILIPTAPQGFQIKQ